MQAAINLAWWQKWGSIVQMIGTVLIAVGVVSSFVLVQAEGWADDRYTSHEQTAEVVTNLGNLIAKTVKEGDKKAVEETILDLEDDIIWFSENDQLASADRRCRKLARQGRAYKELTGNLWESDPVVSRVCSR